MMNYSLEGSCLVIRDPKTNLAVWRGSFDGGNISQVTPLTWLDGCVVVVKESKTYPDRNVLRVGADGAVVWRVAEPPMLAGYTEVELHGKRLLAWSYSGFKILINIHSGVIEEEEFVK